LSNPLNKSEMYIDKSSISNIAILVVLVLLIATYFALFHLSPTIGTNEAVYFLQAMKWSNPNLYVNDWTLNLSNNFGIVFSVFSYPFLSFIEDQGLAIQALRITLWVFLLFCITNLTSAMQIDLKASLLGILLFFILQHTGLMAGAWIFGGAEQKIIAFGLSFLALSAMLKQKYTIAGLFSGLAFFSHVIVGGWSAVGLSILVLLQGRKEFIQYTYCALPLAFVTFLVAFSGIKHDDLMLFEGLDTAESLVLFRNPHHLDAYYFSNAAKAVLMLGCFTIIASTCFVTNTTKAVKITSYYLLIMGAIMILGFAARAFEYFDLLILYPFRVASVTWPLISAIYFSNLLLHFWEQQRFNFNKKSFLKLSIFGVVISFFLAYPLKIIYWDISKIVEGRQINRKQIADNKTYTWINTHTPINSTILANPCRGNFWFSAKRAMVVNFKFTPVNSNYHEWYRRMYILNGSENFTSKGFAVCKELSQNYNSLSGEQLKKIKKLYDTDYYLADEERIELKNCLVFREYGNFVYNLPICNSSFEKAPLRVSNELDLSIITAKKNHTNI
jgi:hypothetical protein